MQQKKNQRIINLEGCYNFREMGGYKTAKKKQTKWGLIYRGGELSRLSADDLEILENFKIKTIIDFRTQEEVVKAPDKKPKTVIKVFNVPVSLGSMDFILENIETRGGEKLMMQINSSAIKEAQAQYREFFKIISNPSNLPLVFHCAGGKDRTGIASALFLSALGVEIETIYDDYLLSAELLRKRYIEVIDINPNLAPCLTVKREYLKAALDTIDNEYGGMKNYLVNKLEVDIELLKSIYTE